MVNKAETDRYCQEMRADYVSRIEDAEDREEKGIISDFHNKERLPEENVA